MRRITKAALFGSLLLVAACTHDQSVDTTADAGGSDVRLAGRWTVACHKVQTVRKVYATESMAFDKSGRFVREIREYKAADCSPASLRDSRAYAGTYKMTGASADYPGAHDIDFTLSRALSTAYGPEAVKQFNETKRCNRVDWKRGERRSILGPDCPGETLAVGTVVYDLVEQEGKRLYFGSTSYFRDGSSPSKRPTRIDQSLAFDRVRRAPVAH